jgi:hypothetical protein
MNAGKIEISVSANYADLERQLREVTDKSTAAGRTAGRGLAQEFDRAASSFSSGIGAKIAGGIAFDKVARGLANALKAGAEGAEWEEVLLSGLRSLPIVGTLSDLISAGIDAGLGFSEQRRIQAEQLETAEKVRKAAEERGKTERTIRDDIEKQRTREEEIVRKIALASVEAEQDARLSARLRAEEEIARLARQKETELDAARSAEQEKSIERRYAKERELVDANLQKEYREIETKEKEAAQRDAERSAAIREKQLEEARTQIEKLEERRQTVASETGTAQTRLGTFRFAAYTDREKKEVDAAILAEIRQIRAKTGTIAQGGFA